MRDNEGQKANSYLVVIDEITVWYVVYQCLRGRAVYLYRVDAVLKPMGRVLDALVGVLKSLRLLRDAADLSPSGEIMMMKSRLFGSMGWYRNVENDFFDGTGISRVESDSRDLIFPLKKQSTNYIAKYFDILFFIHQLQQSGIDIPTLVVGDPVAKPLVANALGERQTFPVVALRAPAVLNLGAVAFVLFASVVHVMKRVRLHPPQKVYRYIGVDGMDSVALTLDPIRSVLGDISDLAMVVLRNRTLYDDMKAPFHPLPVTLATDGVFSVAGAMRAVARTVKDLGFLVSQLGRLYPSHFLAAAKIAYLRAVYDGFFNKYHFDVFWSHDEYNAEHVLRTEALRARGIRSVGRVNGVPVFKIDYAFRYLDFDSAYVICGPAFEKYNGDTWRDSSSIRGFGTFGLSRADLDKVSHPRPKDILCFAKPWSDGSALLKEVAEVAKAFPDRTVTVSVKRTSIRFGGFEEYEDFIANGPKNLVLSEERSFQLILKHTYCVCTESSILAEAIELDTKTLFFDIYDGEQVLIYRDYPSICVRKADDIIRRIKAMEAGTWTYPRDEFSDLVKLSGKNIYDQIREDWGLAPLEAAQVPVEDERRQ